MRVLEDILKVLFALSLLIARTIFWTALGSLPVIYFFTEVDSVVIEIIITNIIVNFCYYKMMVWYAPKNKSLEM